MELLTMQETADLLRIPLASLRHWRATGQGPASARIGRRVVYRRDDVERFITKQFDTAS